VCKPHCSQLPGFIVSDAPQGIKIEAGRTPKQIRSF